MIDFFSRVLCSIFQTEEVDIESGLSNAELSTIVNNVLGSFCRTNFYDLLSDIHEYGISFSSFMTRRIFDEAAMYVNHLGVFHIDNFIEL